MQPEQRIVRVKMAEKNIAPDEFAKVNADVLCSGDLNRQVDRDHLQQ
ncbi:hypothetical protein BMS3Abin13_01863 [bacterium BMS3Abin13]|nr:hypothetical protein BMS3Abin13_01863 [bacterium BMS3Abin13]